MVCFGLVLFLCNQDIYYFSENNQQMSYWYESSINTDIRKCAALKVIFMPISMKYCAK